MLQNIGGRELLLGSGSLGVYHICEDPMHSRIQMLYECLVKEHATLAKNFQQLTCVHLAIPTSQSTKSVQKNHSTNHNTLDARYQELK